LAPAGIQPGVDDPGFVAQSCPGFERWPGHLVNAVNLGIQTELAAQLQMPRRRKSEGKLNRWIQRLHLFKVSRGRQKQGAAPGQDAALVRVYHDVANLDPQYSLTAALKVPWHAAKKRDQPFATLDNDAGGVNT